MDRPPASPEHLAAIMPERSEKIAQILKIWFDEYMRILNRENGDFDLDMLRQQVRLAIEEAHKSNLDLLAIERAFDSFFAHVLFRYDTEQGHVNRLLVEMIRQAIYQEVSSGFRH